MPGPSLASLGSGISETFFGGLAQRQQQEQEQKNKELAMQLAAYHSLLEHDDTPMNSIPDILDAQAKLLKIDKKFKPITDHMRQAIAQRGQVPTGPEETRQIATPQMHMQLPDAQDIPIPTAQVPSMDQQQGPMGGDAPDLSQQAVPTVADGGFVQPTPRPQTYSSVVPIVPPEPTTVTMQATRAYGDLTQGEAQDYRKSQFDIQRQKAILDRQAQLAEAAGDRTAERDVQRQKDELARIEARNAGRMKIVEQTYAEKKKALGGYDTQAAANADKQRLALELQYRAAGMDEDEAKRKAGETMSANMESLLGLHKAQAQRDLGEVQHWRNTDAARLLAKGGAATRGMSAEQARTFRANVIEVMPELNAVRGQLEHLKTLLAQGGTPDPAIQTRIDELEKRHTDLLLQVKGERDKVMATSQSSTPRVPIAPSVRPASDPLGLFGSAPQ